MANEYFTVQYRPKTIFVTDELWARLKTESKAAGKFLNAYVIDLLSKSAENEKAA